MLEFYPLTIVFGITVSLAPFLYLAMIRLFGLRASLFATVFMSVVTYIFYQHDMWVFLSVLEVLVIGSLYKKKGKDLFTWSFVYSFLLIIIMLLAISFGSFTEISGKILVLNIFIGMISIIFAALVADMFCDYYPYIPFINRFVTERKPLHFGQIISYLLIFAAILPILVIIFFHARTLEEDLFQQWEQKTVQLEETLQTKAEEMDSIELKNYALDSEIEKARLKVELDRFTENENAGIYVLNEDLGFWIEAGSLSAGAHDIKRFSTGSIMKIEQNDYIWFPTEKPVLLDWTNANYIGKTKFLEKEVYLVIPLEEGIAEVVSNLKIYLFLCLIVLFVSLFFGLVTNQILSRALGTLTNITSDIPNKVGNEQTIDWKDTSIMEFSQLIGNVRIVAEKLRSMFYQTEVQNQLLIERTNRLMESEAKLFHLAHYDVLTNLPNRHYFYKTMEEQLEKRVNTPTKFAVIFLDLDNFKHINDTFGHSGGDDLLRTFAERLRNFEIENPYAKMFRLAGDEFVSIVDLASCNEINDVRQKLLEVINYPIKIQNKTVEFSASMGVSVFPEDGKTIDTLLHQADTLMYNQKSSHHQSQSTTVYEGEKE